MRKRVLVREDRAGFVGTQQIDELRGSKSFMPNLDNMQNFVSFDGLRQQLEKSFEIGGIKAFRWKELPIDRPELFLEIEDAARKESLDRRFRLGEDAPVGGKPRTLEREHKPFRCLLAPSGKAFGLLRTVIGSVDLDRCQMAARIFEFPLLCETFRIKNPAPRREGPAADANPDCSCHWSGAPLSPLNSSPANGGRRWRGRRSRRRSRRR